MKLTSFFLFVCSICFGQNKDAVKIDSLFVYSFYSSKGYTTASALTQFDFFSRQHSPKHKITDGDCERINQILQKIKPIKHYQTKLGTKVIFVEIQSKGYILKAVFSMGASSVVFNDLTNMREYWIKDEMQREWIEQFIERIKND